MCLLKILKNLNILNLKSSSLIINHNYIIMNFISFMINLNSADFSYINFKKINFLFFLKINVLQEFFI